MGTFDQTRYAFLLRILFSQQVLNCISDVVHDLQEVLIWAEASPASRKKAPKRIIIVVLITSIFFICYMTASQPSLGHCQGDSLTLIVIGPKGYGEP